MFKFSAFFNELLATFFFAFGDMHLLCLLFFFLERSLLNYNDAVTRQNELDEYLGKYLVASLKVMAPGVSATYRRVASS